MRSQPGIPNFIFNKLEIAENPLKPALMCSSMNNTSRKLCRSLCSSIWSRVVDISLLLADRLTPFLDAITLPIKVSTVCIWTYQQNERNASIRQLSDFPAVAGWTSRMAITCVFAESQPDKQGFQSTFQRTRALRICYAN